MISPADARLVVFDIDGTLLATDTFWLDVGRRAVASVYARHEIVRDLPADARFLDAIGMPMEAFWDHVLPEDLRALGAEVEGAAEDLEEAAFAKGLGAMYPGARRLLEDLHGAGRSIGLASNCSGRYLDAFVRSFSLGPWIAAARCADHPGIASKGDMLKEIIAETGEKRAVMIGDRDSDREGARAASLPFVLFAGGFARTAVSDGERVVRNYEELRALLLP